MDTEMINDKVSQGIMLISAEKYDAAKLLREDIIAEAPRTMEAYIHLGNACANLGKYDEAIESFKKALLVDPNYVEAYFSIGSIYVLMNEKVKAIEFYNKAEENGFISWYIVIDPSNWSSTIYFHDVYHNGDSNNTLECTGILFDAVINCKR